MVIMVVLNNAQPEQSKYHWTNKGKPKVPRNIGKNEAQTG